MIKNKSFFIMKMPSSASTEPAGAFFLELVLVLPLLILLVFGALEFHMYMRTAHNLTLVKREALKMAYHHCREYISDPADWGEMDGCLKLRVIDNIGGHAGVLFDDIRILFSFYGLSSGSIVSREAQEEWSSPASQLTAQQSRFDSVQVANVLKPALDQTGAVLLVEIWVTRPGILKGAVGRMLGDIRYSAGVI